MSNISYGREVSFREIATHIYSWDFELENSQIVYNDLKKWSIKLSVVYLIKNSPSLIAYSIDVKNTYCGFYYKNLIRYHTAYYDNLKDAKEALYNKKWEGNRLL